MLRPFLFKGRDEVLEKAKQLIMFGATIKLIELLILFRLNDMIMC